MRGHSRGTPDAVLIDQSAEVLEAVAAAIHRHKCGFYKCRCKREACFFKSVDMDAAEAVMDVLRERQDCRGA